jgi:Spy/CpxP family protein refolding chaperone
MVMIKIKIQNLIQTLFQLKGAFFVNGIPLAPFKFKTQQLLSVLMLGLLSSSFLYGVSWANDPSGKVNWASLDLSPQQQSEIGRLESEWRNIYASLYPQILRDRAELKRLLNEPNTNTQKVMELESRIQANEQKLGSEATRIFLNKKNNLNPVQRVKLQQFIPD